MICERNPSVQGQAASGVRHDLTWPSAEKQTPPNVGLLEERSRPEPTRL
jgi:hypothetical protein